MTALTIDLAIGILGLIIGGVQTWRVQRVKVASAAATQRTAERLAADSVGQLVAALGRNEKGLHDALVSNNHALARFALDEWMENVGAILPALKAAGLSDQPQERLFAASTASTIIAKQKLAENPSGEVNQLAQHALKAIGDARARTPSLLSTITARQLT